MPVIDSDRCHEYVEHDENEQKKKEPELRAVVFQHLIPLFLHALFLHRLEQYVFLSLSAEKLLPHSGHLLIIL